MRLIDADRYKWEIENSCGFNAPVQKDVIRFCSHVVDKMPTVEKYRWHDLRKDHDDLPEPWEYVLIHTYKDEVYVAQTDPIFNVWVLRDSEFDYCEFGSFMVKAWKEIEPFEGTE